MRFPRVRDKLYLPGNAWVLALSAACWSLGSAMANPYQSIYFYAVGSNPVFVGYLLALSSAITATMQLVGGYVADSWGRRKVIVLFSFISTSSAFVYIFVNEYCWLLVPIVLASISGIYGPAFNATLTDSMEPELRARGIASFTLVTSLPSTVCPYFGGVLMQRFGTLLGLRIAYFLSGLFGVTGVSYRALKLKETYDGNKPETTKRILPTISNFIRDNAFILKHASSAAKKLFIYSIAISLGTGMTVPYTSLYVVSALGMSPEYYGLATNLAGVITVLLLLPSVRMVEKFGLKRSAIYASISVPLNQLIFVRAKGMDDLVAWSVIGSASNALLGPSLTALQANLSSRETRGRMMAIFSVFSLIIAVPAQIIGGHLYNIFGPHAPFLASIPAFVLATFVLASIKEPIGGNRD